jgi:lysine biosynthesis protein LysW
MATCPECDAEIAIDPDDLDEMEAGDPWDCDACGSRLRVAGMTPLEFEADDEDEEDEEKTGDDAEAADSEFEEDDLDGEADDADDDKDWDE